jgi:predicted nucleic acid-binding protein
MMLRKVLIDTNVYIAWLNGGRHDEVMLGLGRVRYLSGIVHMELRAGAKGLPARRALDQLVRAYRAAERLILPTDEIFEAAGKVLLRLRAGGREIRRASLVNDVLIALCARSIGASVVTSDSDFEHIRSVVPFHLETVPIAGE